MAKEFYTSGIGSAQILNPSDESKIKIYDDKAAAEADLSNIAENEIIATKAGESEGVVEVVDTVEENNPNAVSSGAVYDYLNDYSISSGSVTSSSTTLTEKINFTATKNGTLYLTITSGSANIAACQISIDGNVVNYDLTGVFPYKKGMTVSVSMRQTSSATTVYKYTRIE